MLFQLTSISVLTQDWQEIVALYEKDNTYLGKVAQPGRPSVCGATHSPSSETLGFQEPQSVWGKRLGYRCLPGGQRNSPKECWEEEED